MKAPVAPQDRLPADFPRPQERRLPPMGRPEYRRLAKGRPLDRDRPAAHDDRGYQHLEVVMPLRPEPSARPQEPEPFIDPGVPQEPVEPIPGTAPLNPQPGGQMARHGQRRSLGHRGRGRHPPGEGLLLGAAKGA